MQERTTQPKMVLVFAVGLAAIVAIAVQVMTFERVPGTNKDQAFATRPGHALKPKMDYRSSEPVEAEAWAAIKASADAYANARLWASCPPPTFSMDDDGYISGAVTPKREAAAPSKGRPDGTLAHAVDFLVRMSKQHGVDWYVGADQRSPMIRDGELDPRLDAEVKERMRIADARSKR